MKAKDENMKFVLRYGSIFVVIFTFVGITTMLSKISIKNKIPMEIVLEHSGEIYGYINKTLFTQTKPIINAYTDDNVVLNLKICSINEDSIFKIIKLKPTNNKPTLIYLKNNPRCTVYLCDGEKKLIDLVFNK